MSPENEVMLDALIAVLDELIAEATAQRAKLLGAKNSAAEQKNEPRSASSLTE